MRRLAKFVADKSFVVVMLALAILFAATLFAQDTNPMPDPKAAGAAAILALTPILSVFVVWGFKLLWNKIPASVVLFLAPVVGVGINYGLAWLAGHPPADPLLAAAMGAVATWVREIGSTLAAKGVAGPITETKVWF